QPLAGGSLQSCLEQVQCLGVFLQPTARMPQLACQPQQLLGVALQPFADELAEEQGVAVQQGQGLLLVGAQQFGGGRGSRCAQVCNKIGDGEIRLVSDGADYRQGTVCD